MGARIVCESDMYMYIFVWPDPENGEKTGCERPSTLDAIKRSGRESAMASEVVADQTQVEQAALQM
jgi:hypothetical protein